LKVQLFLGWVKVTELDSWEKATIGPVSITAAEAAPGADVRVLDPGQRLTV
jgi:hypothetical protein